MLKYAVLLLLLISNKSTAIVIRHDVDDKKYLEIGEKYSPSVAYIGGCAATLVEPSWLMTAAHCVEGKEGAFFTVRHIDTKYRIESIIVHPKFNRKNDELYDVALVQLKDPIFDGAPVKLYQEKDEETQRVVFVGRGTFGNGRDGLIRDDYKQRGATNTINKASEYVIGFTFNQPDKATEFEGISGRGDSGGPAIIEVDEHMYVVGVSSYQVGNGFKEGHYGVEEYYTRVSSVYPWLRHVIDTTQPAELITHPIIDAIKSNDIKALKNASDEKIMRNQKLINEAFYQSVVLDRTDFAKVLVERGAKFEKVVINKVPLYDFVLQSSRKAFFQMLQEAVSHYKYVYPKISAVLPLYISTFRDDSNLLDGVQMLLKQGADLDAQTKSGDTALIITGWNTKNLSLVKLLVSFGADINIPNNNGDTPLMDAAYLGKVDILSYLLVSGADATLKNRRGKTALDLAKNRKNEQAVELLIADKNLDQ